MEWRSSCDKFEEGICHCCDMWGLLGNMNRNDLNLNPMDFYVTLDMTFKPYSWTLDKPLRGCGYNLYSTGLSFLINKMG